MPFKNKTNMPYVNLGNSGLKVSKVILGCMTYGDTRNTSWFLGEKEGIEHIRAAYDAGIQTFDTSSSYSNGESERILGKAIKALALPRDEIVVMTKTYFPVGREPGTSFALAAPGDGPDQNRYVNQWGLSRKHIFASVKASLERLQLDYIDVLLCHRFDEKTPIAETMHALNDVVKAGYAHYIGMSSCYAYEFHAMQNHAITNGLTPFILMENHYSLLYREEEREMMPTLKLFGVGCTPWSPLGRGALTKPLGEQSKRANEDWFLRRDFKGAGNAEIINRVEELAKKKGLKMVQIALAWCFSKPLVTAPIIGVMSLENLQDIIGSIHLTLTEEEVNYLEEPYQPQGILGHDMDKGRR